MCLTKAMRAIIRYKIEQSTLSSSDLEPNLNRNVFILGFCSLTQWTNDIHAASCIHMRIEPDNEIYPKRMRSWYVEKKKYKTITKSLFDVFFAVVVVCLKWVLLIARYVNVDKYTRTINGRIN